MSEAKKPKKVTKKPVKKVVAATPAEEPLAAVVAEVAKELLLGEYVPEASTSGVPKNFVIRCPKCRWARLSSGVAADLSDLHEIKSNCKNCGKFRKFQCPKCGTHSTMKRLHGNSPAKGTNYVN